MKTWIPFNNVSFGTFLQPNWSTIQAQLSFSRLCGYQHFDAFEVRFHEIVEFSKIFINSLWLEFLTNLDAKGTKRRVVKWRFLCICSIALYLWSRCSFYWCLAWARVRNQCDKKSPQESDIFSFAFVWSSKSARLTQQDQYA